MANANAYAAYQHMSNDTLMDIAAQSIRPDFNARNRAAYARIELKSRIFGGRVDDMDHDRAHALGLVK